MCLFIETIRIEEGIVCNLPYHNQRMNATRSAHFGDASPLDLSAHIRTPENKDRIKCRVAYDQSIRKITYAPYTVRPVSTLQLVYPDAINYRYKSTNREELNKLFNAKGKQDEILIVKEKKLTDTSIANIALFDGNRWYTPTTPLLEGTQRAFLLNNSLLTQKEILLEELFSYQQIALFNAMIPFGEIIIPIDKEHINL
ncbi:aminotransferase class IV family protein [uncultured Bacteroides sp.]|uniref:aminotransferase class IV family protein n=1 Tax=uncultured Bacteroides sp. TaxID=162156 RepID=UPI002AAB3824|nr:aminotransferase class IV family protein [uncultured Bacteroides sp.]